MTPAVNPPASGTSYTLTEPILVTSTVLFDPIDFPGGVTGPEPYPAVKPSPFNTIPRVFDSLGTEILPDRIPEGPPLTIPDDLATIPTTGAQYSTTLALHDWFTVLPDGQYAVESTYVNFAQDPLAPPCSGATCLWTGESSAGEVTITIGDPCPGAPAVGSGAGGTGCAFAVKATVTLVTVNIAPLPQGSITTSTPAGAQIRVFDKANAAFLLVAGSSNPPGAKMGIIFEANAGLAGTCVTAATPTAGTCVAGVNQTGTYLTIMKFFDPATGKSVYVGTSQTASSFNSTTKIATEAYLFSKILVNGTFVSYVSLSKFTVTGSILEVMAPESAVWDGTKNIYPFIFTSDSDWTVDVCAAVPGGYKVLGVYNEQGALVPSTQCTQTIVTGAAKVVAFAVEDIGSPEPSLTASFTMKNHKSGKITRKQVQSSDIRKQSFKRDLAHAKALKRAYFHQLHAGTP